MKKCKKCGEVVQDLAIPLAVWLGSKEIYLIGCDCDHTGYYDGHKQKHALNDRKINQYKFFKNRLDKIGIGIYNINYKKHSCPSIPKISPNRFK